VSSVAQREGTAQPTITSVDGDGWLLYVPPVSIGSMVMPWAPAGAGLDEIACETAPRWADTEERTTRDSSPSITSATLRRRRSVELLVLIV
jgi:hypothetical protein